MIPRRRVHGYSPRGMDIDRNGVVWTVLASGHFASFDRRKCKGPLNGPNATGKQCPEGWTLYPFPGRNSATSRIPAAPKPAIMPGSISSTHSVWATISPIATGNASDALFALVDGKFMTLRVPYPMGFYAKGLDGRIDDAGRAGKAAACGPPMPPARRSTWKAARARPARWCTSSSGPIRWRIEGEALRAQPG